VVRTVRAMTSTETTERADLLEALRAHRRFLEATARDLTDEQANQRTTASELTIAGILKHVATTEASWASFILEGPGALAMAPEDWAAQFRMGPDETLAGLLERYREVAARTDELVASLPDLDVAHPLPEAPWFEPGAVRSARRVLLHIVAETAQHAGHADIIRESLDGARTMG
jgi:uncharacterized damage-inducible protein DinB